MAEIKTLSIGGNEATGTILTSPGGENHPNLIIIECNKGFLMCGYVNMAACEKFGDVTVQVGGASFDEVLKNPIKAFTSKAAELGVKDGMTGLEAAEILNS